MSGLLDEINAQNFKTRNRCPIASILSKLDEKDRADLEAALVDDAVPAGAIARALVARGMDLNPNGERIRVHRRGQCGCARG